MAKRVSAAQAKAHLSALTAEVAYGGQRVVIERRGTPLAAIVSVDDLERLEQDQAGSARPLGALALVGRWDATDDAAIDAFIDDIYRAREADTGRPVDLEA